MFWEQPLDPDVSDRYGLVLDDGWLDGETVTSATFTAPIESGITITNISLIESPQISALFSGGVDGFWPINVRIETATRQREFCMTLWVKQGC